MSSSESVLVPTPTLLSIFYFFAFPFLSNIVVARSEKQPVGFDRRHSTEQTRSGAVPERTRNLKTLVRGCRINEVILPQ